MRLLSNRNESSSSWEGSSSSSRCASECPCRCCCCVGYTEGSARTFFFSLVSLSPSCSESRHARGRGQGGNAAGLPARISQPLALPVSPVVFLTFEPRAAVKLVPSFIHHGRRNGGQSTSFGRVGQILRPVRVFALSERKGRLSVSITCSLLVSSTCY
jgi:hypothetical protein